MHKRSPTDYSYTIQTSEDLVGILMQPSDRNIDSELLIWNWKTGQLVLVGTYTVFASALIDRPHSTP